MQTGNVSNDEEWTILVFGIRVSRMESPMVLMMLIKIMHTDGYVTLFILRLISHYVIVVVHGQELHTAPYLYRIDPPWFFFGILSKSGHKFMGRFPSHMYTCSQTFTEVTALQAKKCSRFIF